MTQHVARVTTRGARAQRPPASVLRDVLDEIVSSEIARVVYGVALTEDGESIDAAATAKLRAA